MDQLVQIDKKRCSFCGDNKKLTEYYKSYSILDKFDERLKVCKVCLKGKFDCKNTEEIKNMLRMIDKPFNINLWESANTKNDVIGEYFKLINAKDFKNDTWAQSIFNAEQKNTKTSETNVDFSIKNKDILDDLKEKYGHGYPDEEYILFEKKFNNLKPSFQLPTTMHEEYLREYCVNKVKETMAKALGEFKEAKEWSAMAKESANGGKLMPSQMTKSDLSQGLDGFGQLARMVEENQDIIPLLPKFTSQPKDDVDVTLWMYINYSRDVQGMPPASYDEIYGFYNERVDEYNKLKLDNSGFKKGEEDE